MENNRNEPNKYFRKIFFKDLDGLSIREAFPEISFRETLPSEARLSEEESTEEFSRLWQEIREGKTRAYRLVISRLSIAASIALLLASAALLWYIRIYNLETQVVSPYGKVTKVWLPDSSLVVLNANSQLSYPANWEKGSSREVTLEGEAFFTVRKQHVPKGDVKFVVHSRDWDIEVLGTEFNVLNRGSLKQVVLESGKIKLTPESGASIQMQPGQLAEQTSKDHEVNVESVNPADFGAWRFHEMVVRNLTLQEIILKIEQIYDVQVVLANQKSGRVRLTGTYPTNNLNLLVTMVAGSANLKVRWEDNRITFF
ncbi:FecR family protein [Persicitalea jodogahamensis]|uniref:FecR family protein n=1 Tax=Persicitalea jodogahamensis TaxID=402147 RepID=A0A8J3DFG0_9BACT|nr:FecR domain-containing protein [Persicitalea jodogahamensis]GHB86561.1 hypothetical protein GCM10007390_47690 [Persicitalea jodogahamensis]